MGSEYDNCVVTYQRAGFLGDLAYYLKLKNIFNLNYLSECVTQLKIFEIKLSTNF